MTSESRLLPGEPHQLPRQRTTLAGHRAKHFRFMVVDRVATITLSRPERKNPLTFDSYAELDELFRLLTTADDVKAIVLTGDGGNFCSGGDVHEIIGPLTRLDMPGLLAFTRLTGSVIRGMRACPQPIVAAIDGVCAGAGAPLAIASDFRLGTPRSTVAFLFNRVGLAGCDMGACAILPRLIGQGRAAELLYTGRTLGAEEGERWGFFNHLHEPERLLEEAGVLAHALAHGPTFANSMTKRMLHAEWNLSLDEAIEAEAQAQAVCMATNDFHRAYHAFVDKRKPTFEGD